MKKPIYLAVNKNGEFRIFIKGYWKPDRRKKEYLIRSKNKFDEDIYGNPVYKWVSTGETEEIWSIYLSSEEGYYDGEIINKNILSEELQKMTWKDEPIKIN